MYINTNRTDNLLDSLQCRLSQIQNFTEDKISKLETQKPALGFFLEDVGGFELEIGNMYSTGIGVDTYTGKNKMIAHGKFTLRKEYKNVGLITKKLEEAFTKNIPSQILTAEFLTGSINGTEVEFKIWIQ